MENTSLQTDVWNDYTASSSKEDYTTQYAAQIRNVVVKVASVFVGSVGVLDNLFVIIVFALFIKVADKVLVTLIYKLVRYTADSECASNMQKAFRY